ncbi:MAG: DUF1015 family protein, partial [Planctomycetota bacterium]
MRRRREAGRGHAQEPVNFAPHEWRGGSSRARGSKVRRRRACHRRLTTSWPARTPPEPPRFCYHPASVSPAPARGTLPMPTVAPLRGLRYDPKHVGALSQVIAPPYDVIDGALQTKLYERHPANVIRLELNREEPG